MKSYKELIAYKKSYELTKLIYELTSLFPKEELYSLTSQIRRCAVSIPSNIAEGYMRGTKEYIQFLKIAMGSAAELETQLQLSFDLGYCKSEIFKTAYNLDQEVMKLLSTYISKLTKT
ncbi:MAG: four helix bundle protein [Nitrospinae bacterium]|nr:four helix bundle protein [Nitrospinota bacterium]